MYIKLNMITFHQSNKVKKVSSRPKGKNKIHKAKNNYIKVSTPLYKIQAVSSKAYQTSIPKLVYFK